MIAGEGQNRRARTSALRRATFDLERFAWGAPDRLQVSGRFTGLGDVPQGDAVLVVRGPERAHRLKAVPDSVSGSLEDGSQWSAEFAWQEPPVAFDAATLELGPEIVVELPEPSARRRWGRGQTLEVRNASDETSAEGTAGRPEGTELDRQVGGQLVDPSPERGAERVRLEAELLAAQEEIRELRADAAQVREELARAREDVKNERERHAGDAERYREGLARVRASAADAVAVEQSAAQQVESALREARIAIEAKDADLEQLRAQLEEAAAARAQAESEAQNAAHALRDHRVGLRDARRAADKARADGEHLLKRLETIRDALGDGR